MFEFDPNKSATNLAKHGIDFETAQQLWQDKDALVVPAKTVDEPRWALIGSYQGKIWLAVYTMRGDCIRLISVRRARKNEEEYYHESFRI